MWPYWLMFLFPAFAAIHNSRDLATQKVPGKLYRLNKNWFLVTFTLTLLIGFRFEVGGDWYNYIQHYEAVRHKSFLYALSYRDLGYQAILWLCAYFDLGIYGVNLISAAPFSFGVAVFCRNLPRPWLALSTAVPYLVIVVGMGYTRQGIAIGLSMLGLVALGKQSIWKFVFWVILAALFHKSAVLLLPIAALAATHRRYLTAMWIVIICLGAYFFLLQDSIDYYVYGYIEREYQSSGAFIRLLMNALPAAVLLLKWRRFEMTFAQFRLWKWCAVISFVLIAVFYVSPSSTAVDRVALLFLPLQLVVFSYFPEVFGLKGRRNNLFTVSVLLYYATIQFVWLNYAFHSEYWVPYQFYPLLDVF